MKANILKYYPTFGSSIPELQYAYSDGADTSKYRFGFNTQERDDEIAGAGNIFSAEFWEYDARLARRFNIDPIFKEYESAYACLGNNPLWIIDINGADSTAYLKFPSDITNDQRAKIKQELAISYKKAGLDFLKIVEVNVESVNFISDYNFDNDQFIEYTHGGGFKGKTTYRTIGNIRYYFSSVNLDEFKNNDGSYSFRKIGLTSAHETTHSFIERIFSRYFLNPINYGLSRDWVGDPNGGHYDIVPNLLNSSGKLDNNGRSKLLKSGPTVKIEKNLKAVYLLIHKHLNVVAEDSKSNANCNQNAQREFSDWIKKDFIKTLKTHELY